MCGLTTTATILRTTYYLRKRGNLLLDDWLVIFAAICLIIQTSVNYVGADSFYLTKALNVDPSLLRTKGQILSALGSVKWSMITSVFGYTANYMIKLSFLAFFRSLIRNVSTLMNIYWKAALFFTLIAWVFSVCSTLIMCPYFGLESSNLAPS